MKNAKRITELDSFRGIAAMIVVLFHYITRSGEYGFTDIKLLSSVAQYGHYGVQLFFVISGFVIFMTVEKTKNAFVFMKKRCVRLYPTFWLSLILTFIIVHFFGPEDLKVSVKDFIVNFTMLSALFNTPPVDGVYWTLKVEMAFYFVIFGMMLLRIVKRQNLLGFLYLLAGVLLFVLFRPLVYYHYGLLFLIGINFYEIWKAKKGSLINYIQIILALGLSFFYGFEVAIVTTILVVLFTLFVYGILGFLNIRPFLFLGKISYALYLVHQYIGYTIQYHLSNMGIDNDVTLIIIPLSVSILLAYIITYYYEVPLQRKIRRFI